MITGFGRTGKWFALDHWGVEPDVFQFAKAITSGYFPLGGVGVAERIAKVLDHGASPWMHAYTYSAHPVGCAVALRNLDILEREGLPAQAAQKGDYLLAQLRASLADHPHVGEVRGKGLMCRGGICQRQIDQGGVRPCKSNWREAQRRSPAAGPFQPPARGRLLLGPSLCYNPRATGLRCSNPVGGD